MCFRSWLGLSLLKFRNIFRCKQVVRSCNVLTESFWEHGNWFFQLKSSSGARRSWRSAEIVGFGIPWNSWTVNINVHLKRLTVKNYLFDGWRLHWDPRLLINYWPFQKSLSNAMWQFGLATDWPHLLEGVDDSPIVWTRGMGELKRERKLPPLMVA